MKTSSWHFFFPAPEPLPVEDGYANYRWPSSTVQSANGKKRPSSDSATILFHQVEANGNAYSAFEAIDNTLKKRSISRLPDERVFPRTDRMAFTIAEVVVSKSYQQDLLGKVEGSNDPISKAFDFALEQLNVWLDSLSIVTSRPYENIRRESLPSVTIVAEGAYEPWELAGRALPKVRAQTIFNVNVNLRNATAHPEPIDELDHIIESALMAVTVPGPFASYYRLYSQARNHLHIRGDYAISVILFASACESLFSELLQHLLWEKGKTPYEAAEVFLNKSKQPKGIAGLVKNDLYPILRNEKWKKCPSNEILVWQKKIAELRNRIIHSDYRPKFDEVCETEQAVATLIGFVTDKVFDIREKSPITALALLGQDGLDQRNDWERFSTLELDPGTINMRMRAFRRWSQLVAAHREAPSLRGSRVDAADSYAVLVVEGQTPVEAFVVNKTKIVAKRIDLSKALGFPGFRNCLNKAITSWPCERVAAFPHNLGGFSLPKDARWESYAYEEIPWDTYQFSDLAKRIGYDFSAFGTQE